MIVSLDLDWLIDYILLSFFLSFPILHVNIESMCHSFHKNIEARILKLSILIGNEFLYCGIWTVAPCPYFSIFIPQAFMPRSRHGVNYIIR